MADLRMGGDAARRAAESLLRSMGGRSVSLRLPAPATGLSVNEQIGLGVPEFQDTELSPVVFRKARPQLKANGPRWELMVSAISVAGVVGAIGATDSGTAGADELFASAFGVVVGETLMQIESVSSSDMDGTPYVYRLVLRTAAADVV